MVEIIKYITRQSHKPLILIPVILMILSLLYIGVFGLNEGVDLKGGTLVTVELNQPMTQSQVTQLVEFKVLSFRSVGALLSDAALGQIYYALLFAFVFMSVTVFFVFRDLTPSLAIILSAVCNLSIAVGSMSLFGIPLSIASVGALLMLIGYGVDTDILLTTRLLKRRHGSLDDRAEDACRTGLTLTFATLAAMIVLFIVVKVFIPTAQVLEDISAVLIIGLLSDLLSTWLMNLGILKWHIERGGHD